MAYFECPDAGSGTTIFGRGTRGGRGEGPRHRRRGHPRRTQLRSFADQSGLRPEGPWLDDILDAGSSGRAGAHACWRRSAPARNAQGAPKRLTHQVVDGRPQDGASKVRSRRPRPARRRSPPGGAPGSGCGTPGRDGPSPDGRVSIRAAAARSRGGEVGSSSSRSSGPRASARARQTYCRTERRLRGRPAGPTCSQKARLLQGPGLLEPLPRGPRRTPARGRVRLRRMLIGGVGD